MNIAYIIAVVSLFWMCGSSNLGSTSNQIIEYQMDSGQYAVVVVMDGISASQARKVARQRAAEVVIEQGNRYFTIDSEQETEVIKSDEGFNNQPVNGNLYQELIIERDFSRERLKTETIPTTSTYPAIRIVFTSYKQKPNWKAIDAYKVGGRPPS